MTIQIVTRKFHVKPIVMLTAAMAACKNLEVCIADFGVYPYMTQEWIDTLYADAEQLIKATGRKANEQQRAATAKVQAIRHKVINTALIVKNQIERGFIDNKPRLDEILNLLGYRANWTKANNGNQIALLELVLTFSSHTDNLGDELTEHRVSAEQISIMKNYANTLNEANLTQETLKSATPIITADMNMAFNNIYDRMMDICSAGKIIYRHDPVKKSLFSFRRLSSRQISSGSTKPNDTANENHDTNSQ